jgi:hypothetical protein
MSTTYLPPMHMHPVDVTSVDNVEDLKLASYPKHVVSVTEGLYVAVNSEGVWLYHNDELKEITSVGVTDTIFGALMPAAYKFNCVLSCIVYHSKLDLSIVKDEFLKQSDTCRLNYEDFSFLLLDAFCKQTPGQNVTLRQGLMCDIDEYVNENNFYIANYSKVHNYNELMSFTTKELLEDKTASVLCKTTESMYIDNVAYTRLPFKSYSTFIRLSCNILYEGILTAMSSLEKEIAEGLDVVVTARCEIKWNTVVISNISLINPLNNIDLNSIWLLRKLHFENKSKLIGKPVIFTGFSSKKGDIPIGCTFLRYKQL